MPRQHTYKFLELITILYITNQIVTLVIAGKLVSFWWVIIPASTIFFPFTYIFDDIITEVYGYAHARRTIYKVILCTIIASIIYQIVANLPSAPGFAFDAAYQKVLGSVPRILIGSWIAVWSGAFLNNYVLAKMKIWTKGKHLWTRTIGSTIVGEGINTVVFYSFAFLGVISLPLLIKTILIGWPVKVLIEAMCTPVTYWVVKKLKRIEREDYYDIGTNFSPFTLKIDSSPKKIEKDFHLA
jgi:queuosine precursor transporter